MVERAIRQAMRKIGTRADALGTCPVCGHSIGSEQAKVRVWQGRYAHESCAAYHRRGPHSQRVHDSFTAT
jgi:ribosomal protein L37AE/L43A